MNRTALQGLAAGTVTLCVAALLASPATRPTSTPSAPTSTATVASEDFVLSRDTYGLDQRASRSKSRVPAQLVGPSAPPLPEPPAPEPPPAAAPPAAAPTPAVNRSDPRSIARALLASRGWNSDWDCLDSLWQRESEWKTTADNPRSSAYGIPQALPGRRMAAAGSDWRTNPETQIRWGLSYISARYGDPCSAWAHSQRQGWY